jgi:hypothetical protein
MKGAGFIGSEWVKQGVFFALLAIIIGVEFAYRKPLFQRSVELQIDLQPHITNSGKIFFKGLSLWGDGPVYFIIFIYVFLQESRARSFYYIFFITFTMFIMNLTKMAYHEPRPFMTTDSIKIFGCSPEYGNPSGHSIFAAAMDTFVFLDIFYA